MMIWLCVYYDFYCEKVDQKENARLIQFFEKEKRALGLSKEHLNILSCFLDLSNMVREEQSSIPQNLNAETLESIKAEKPKSKQSSDLIWEFFDTKNAKLDSSDIDLRHALANMIAVVFSLPSRSTHLWYHMFAPGDLKNSYLTGFMVCSIYINFYKQ